MNLYDGFDMNSILALNGNHRVIDPREEPIREGAERYVHVRRLDERGSTTEESLIGLSTNEASVVVAALMADDLAYSQLRRKLRMVRRHASQGIVACDAGLYEFWF